jgi:hypothetical protein
LLFKKYILSNELGIFSCRNLPEANDGPSETDDLPREDGLSIDKFDCG